MAEVGLGSPVGGVCRKLRRGDATFYSWERKDGGLGPSELRRLRQLVEENDTLKRLVADVGLDKILRVQHIALENKLPFINLVESAGANLMKYRVEGFVHGGALFRNLARLSSAGVPVTTGQHDSGRAGGPDTHGHPARLGRARNSQRKETMRRRAPRRGTGCANGRAGFPRRSGHRRLIWQPSRARAA